MTKRQKINSLEDFYVKPARQAEFLSRQDFNKTMRWGSVAMFVIGAVLFCFVGMGLISGATTDKAPVFIIIGLLICVSAILSIAFPGFRRFFDGGTISDIYDLESADLAAAWAQSVPDAEVEQMNLEDPLFWGTTKALSCIVLIKWDQSGEGGNECFLAAHCDKSRKGKAHPSLGKGKCVGLNLVFCGGFEEIEEQLNELNEQSLETMRKVIEVNPKMQLDPLIYGPYSDMLCPRT